MRIQYVGLAGLRILREYRFDEENGYTADVDAQTAVELLTYPRPDFCLSRDEPLLALDGMTTEMAEELALNGIGSIEDLANITPDAAANISERNSQERVETWIEQAQAIINHRPEETPAESIQEGGLQDQED